MKRARKGELVIISWHGALRTGGITVTNELVMAIPMIGWQDGWTGLFIDTVGVRSDISAQEKQAENHLLVFAFLLAWKNARGTGLRSLPDPGKAKWPCRAIWRSKGRDPLLSACRVPHCFSPIRRNTAVVMDASLERWTQSHTIRTLPLMFTNDCISYLRAHQESIKYAQQASANSSYIDNDSIKKETHVCGFIEVVPLKTFPPSRCYVSVASFDKPPCLREIYSIYLCTHRLK